MQTDTLRMTHIFMKAAVLWFWLVFQGVSSASGAAEQVLCDFSDDTSVLFTENIERVSQNGEVFGRLSNRGRRWVETESAPVTLRHRLTELNLQARSSDVKRLAVRITDESGQVFQHRLELTGNGDWEILRITNPGKASQIWGGAGDRVFHDPLKSIRLILEHEGSVDVRRICAITDAGSNAVEIEVSTVHPGNIFFGSEPQVLHFVSRHDTVEWKISDYRGELAARGVITASETGSGSGISEEKTFEFGPGYYWVCAEAGGRTAYLPFAVVPEFKADPEADGRFGVMTHFAQGMPVDIIPLLSNLGITSVRDEHYWGHIEKERGQFVFLERNVDYMKALDEAGIEPLVAMTFENELYDNGNTPYTQDGIEAYGRYGKALLRQWPGQISALEIWNEYNGSWCKGPAAENRPKSYAALLKGAYRAIKDERPDVRVLGCAPVLIPLPYLEGIFKEGGLDFMDAVVIHPYRAAPEGVEKEVASLEEMIRRYSGGRDVPIWVTETGRHDTGEYEWKKNAGTYEKGRHYVSVYLARQYALLLTRNVERIYWYLCRDYQNFVTMGLLRNIDDPIGRYAVAPAYVTYATLIRQLHGARFVERSDSGHTVYLLRFSSGESDVWVCWSLQPKTVCFSTDGPAVMTDTVGASTTLTPFNGQIAVTLDEHPVYLRGNLRPLEGGEPFFSMESPQTTDILEKAFIEAEISSDGAEFICKGKPAVMRKGRNRIVIEEEPAKQEKNTTYSYRLRTDSGMSAAGFVSVRVRDPIKIECATLNRSAGKIEALLHNSSQRVPYVVDGSELACGGYRRVAVPFNGQVPYRAVPVEFSLDCLGREPVRYGGALSWNPVGGSYVLSIPENGSRWGKTKLSAKIKINADDGGVRISGKVSPASPRGILVAGIYDEDPEVLKLSEFAVGDSGAVDAVIPWENGKRPESGLFRLAMAFYEDGLDKSIGCIEWPSQSIGCGVQPDGFAECFISGTRVQPAPFSEPAPVSVFSKSETIYDSEADYTKKQGENNTWFGYFDGSSQNPYSQEEFKEMTHVQTVWGYVWSSEKIKYLSQSAGTAHPGLSDGRQVWAVRRWKSFVTGKIRLSGKAKISVKSTGAAVKIVSGGIVRGSFLLKGGEEQPFDAVLAVKEGDYVDFCITPGEDLNIDYDSVSYNYKIEQLK